MLLVLWLLPLIQVVRTQGTAINVADVPQCARDCLTNSTAVVASTCGSLNVACLCNSPQFVSTFYCCLSTHCGTADQATAITFNQQQCAAVNATAPDFVGCSPLKTTASTGGTKSAITATSANGGPYSTVATVVSESASLFSGGLATAGFDGQALLTGSCTAPLFAVVTPSGGAFLFPQVGCAPNRQDCCPFDVNANVVITKCPQDYFTTANGCCPSGYEVYSAAIGFQTPCYSNVSPVLIPASTPSVSALTVVTDRVFSRKYELASTQSNSPPAGVIAGIVIAVVVLAAVAVLTLRWFRGSKKQTQPNLLEIEKTGITFPAQEPVLPPQSDLTSPHELASPESMGLVTTTKNHWPGVAVLPYNNTDRTKSPPVAAKSFAPQELPGSTYINEHHPAFVGSENAIDFPGTERVTQTPGRGSFASTTRSPMVTPVPEDHQNRTMSPGIISPIGSPRLPRTTTESSVISDRE